MLNYNIPAPFIYLHNHSTLDLLPSAAEKAWQKLAMSICLWKISHTPQQK